MSDNSDDIRWAEAWDQFCDQLKMAKHVLFRESAPTAEKDRAAGLRMLARNISYALDKVCENADPLHPEFTHNMDWRRKFGGDNPDSLYLWAPVNGDETYRIVGTRGSATFLAFTLSEGGNVATGGPPVASLFGDDLHFKSDGTFELILSPEPPEPQATQEPPRNWIKTTPKSSVLLVRQFFGDWENERPMSIHIDRIGDPVPAPDISAESVATGLFRTAQWLEELSTHWAKTIELWQHSPLEFLPFNKVTKGAMSVTPGGVPLLCYWSMAADEALIIRVTPPPAIFWNIELGNWWFETMDYRYRLSGTNSHYAVREADGEVIMVLSHDDPGLPNWLDASGYSMGYLACRWVGAKSSPEPSVRRVKRAELFDHLPMDVRRINSEERQRQLVGRRIGVMKRFAGM